MKTQTEREALAVTAGGMIALAVALGIGRFAFTPLLPMMLRQHELTLEQGSWLASANYLGYFLGALSVVWIEAAPKTMIRAGLALTAVLTFGMGVTHSLPFWLLLRGLSGIASAWILVYASAWGLRRLTELQCPAWGGALFSGVGMGILLTGLLCLGFAEYRVSSAEAWRLLGGGALALSLCVWNVWGESDAAPQAAAQAETIKLRWDRATVILALCYGLFGFGYIIPATFLPVIARQTVHSALVTSLFWPLLGAAALLSTLTASALARKTEDRLILAVSYLMQALGVGALVVPPTLAGLTVSALLVGGTFMVMTMFGLREARRLGGEQTGKLMGVMTAAFAVGQIVGPLYAGVLVRLSGSFSSSLLTAAILLASGAALLWRNK
ncbi:MAG: YbfB/YjiJ family MFS transporter [Armatimonadota bacterium]|nr:YbfB/YjiJ family MFS transporter [Armatimonadota bacterium]